MKAALLDLNVLVALFWPDHEHHAVVVRWFQRRGDARWASCPLTQLGFIRLVSNPAFSREALSPGNAARLLARNIDELRNHDFWPDDLDMVSAMSGLESTLQGYRQITDAYLVSLARKHRGVFATFDRGVKNLAGETLAIAVEVVPV